MPQNKRESLIYIAMMCSVMVLWMSTYNAAIQMGYFGPEAIKEGWMGFPAAYLCSMTFDWFLVSGNAKKFAFRFLVTPDSSSVKKIIAVSCCTVVPMVVIMSLYGSLQACIKTGAWNLLFAIWMTNIPRNLAMALPFQLLVAGPIVRKLFRMAFPVGKILA